MLPSIQFSKYDAQIFLQGAQLTSFKDWLFLSPQSNFATGKAIRGGIPVVFPYFGPHPTDSGAPQHGFARTALWEIERHNEDSARLILERDNFLLKLSYVFGDTLKARLTVENHAKSAREFEVALHTYLAVSDVRDIIIQGVDGKNYLDKVDDFAQKFQSGDLRLDSPTDRVYLDCGGPIVVCDVTRAFSIQGNYAWKSTIVWNPFAPMADLTSEDWKCFVCVESGAVADDAPTIEAGGRYDLLIEISLI